MESVTQPIQEKEDIMGKPFNLSVKGFTNPPRGMTRDQWKAFLVLVVIVSVINSFAIGPIVRIYEAAYAEWLIALSYGILYGLGAWWIQKKIK